MPKPVQFVERLADITSARQSKDAFERVLSVSCEVHAARPGEPCWAVLERWKIAEHRAVCGPRIRAAGYVGKPSARSLR